MASKQQHETLQDVAFVRDLFEVCSLLSDVHLGSYLVMQF